MSAIVITNENFEEEVLNATEPVLVDFWAEWCGPCRMLSPIIEQIAEEKPEIKICKVNIDEQPEIAERYQVMSIPTLLVFKNGEIAQSAVGARPKQFILDMLQ